MNRHSQARAVTTSSFLKAASGLVSDFTASCSAMDDDDIALIRQLRTRAGCIMEDSSVIALIWEDGLPLEAWLAKLAAAANDIHALVAAAQALMSH
jgi:hypothetical protein